MRTRLQTQKRESAAVGGTDFGYSGLLDGLRKVRGIAQSLPPLPPRPLYECRACPSSDLHLILRLTPHLLTHPPPHLLTSSPPHLPALLQAAKDEGIAVLWRGLLPRLLLKSMGSMIWYTVYMAIRRS